MSKKTKFRDIYASQTDIGKRFGLSGVAIGKILIANSLRDPKTKQATELALSEKWCVSTPLKSGEVHYMWNIKRVSTLLESSGSPSITKEEVIANEIIATIRSANRELDRGNDKLAFLTFDSVLNEVPIGMRPKVASYLHAKGFGDFVSRWAIENSTSIQQT